MKSNNILTIFFSLVSMISVAQVDRSKVPPLGDEPVINLGEPSIYRFDNGLTLMVVENHKFPKVNLSLVIDAPSIFEGDKVGVQSLASSLMGNGSKTISKEDFEDEVEFLGASLSVGMRHVRASSLSRFFPRIMELLSSAVLEPNFTQEELDKERLKKLQQLKMAENNASAIMSRVEGALFYGKDHAYGEFETEQSLSAITLDDVKNFYSTHFVPNNAYVIISGDITPKEAKDLVEKYLVGEKSSLWKVAPLKKHTFVNTPNVKSIEVDFIDMPTAVQSEILVGNLIDIKTSDKDYFPLLIANHILGGDFNSYVNMNLREKNGFTYGARSHFGTDKYYRPMFSVATQVRNDVTAAAVQEIINEVERIINIEVTDDQLERSKAKYLGSFIMATENPAVISSYALRIKTDNLPEDFYKNYIKNINAVTKQDVIRVAKKYFRPQQFRIIIVGKKSDIAPSLDKLNYNGVKIPVHYYDKQANITE